MGSLGGVARPQPSCSTSANESAFSTLDAVRTPPRISALFVSPSHWCPGKLANAALRPCPARTGGSLDPDQSCDNLSEHLVKRSSGAQFQSVRELDHFLLRIFSQSPASSNPSHSSAFAPRDVDPNKRHPPHLADFPSPQIRGGLEPRQLAAN